MIPGLSALGIRFDIGKINSAAYGARCWKVFWNAVQPGSLKGSLLYEGDTAGTLDARENVYCIAVQNIRKDVLDLIRRSLERHPAFLAVAPERAFLTDEHVWNEPLVEAGRVDAAGQFIRF